MSPRRISADFTGAALAQAANPISMAFLSHEELRSESGGRIHFG